MKYDSGFASESLESRTGPRSPDSIRNVGHSTDIADRNGTIPSYDSKKN